VSLLFYLEEAENNNENTTHYFESDSARMKCEEDSLEKGKATHSSILA